MGGVLVLRLDNVHASLGAFAITADVDIKHPQRIAILGPSGGGKSTFLNLIAGFVEPRVGTVFWNDTDMPLYPGDRPISMLFQDNNVFPHLTVFQNVGLGLRPSLRLSLAEKDSIATALHRVGLQGKEDAHPADLSGGQQSRIALARVLVQDNPILLLDEPFAALGPALKRDLLDEVISISQDKTVLMVTHDPEDAKAFADQVIFVADGQVRDPMGVDEIFANPPAAFKDYL